MVYVLSLLELGIVFVDYVSHGFKLVRSGDARTQTDLASLRLRRDDPLRPLLPLAALVS